MSTEQESRMLICGFLNRLLIQKNASSGFLNPEEAFFLNE